ncbi:MAG: hypothetical protein AAB263_22090, partial [Planctomycetota bacterium]
MCHSTQPGWSPAGFPVHDNYYPLNGAHAAIANECATCHNGNYVNTPNTCAACHLTEYNSTTNPNHASAQFPTDCASCHAESTWTPASFDHDGQFFPIYSGTHQGEWSQCVDCHSNPANYAQVVCTTCHANPETDDQHASVGGYVFEDFACLACHPTGEAGGSFDHNNSGFPLTGAHLAAECLACHPGGNYQGTPTACSACHLADFNQSTNPNHVALGLPADCATCHSTEPGWSPATFAIHNNFYVLNGAHALIANDCAACHNGNYNATPNTCNGCHADDYAAATDPNHAANQLPTDCQTCHSETAWTPSTFDHATVYPFNGAHVAIANDCALCHLNGNYANTPNTCNGCHSDDYAAAADPNHAANQFPTDCETCHSEAAWVPATFDHDEFYPLTGGHLAVANDCVACHLGGNYSGTPNTCAGCHLPHFNSATNPNHVALNLPTDCEMCHTTSPDWQPATFPLHDNFYVLNGAHAN